MTEFLSKLAQFSSIGGELISSLQSNKALQASALVGRKVLVASKNFVLANHQVQMAIDFVEEVSNVIAQVYSESGELIKAWSLSEPAVGLVQFAWDGNDDTDNRVDPGNYHVKVAGTKDGQEFLFNTLIMANVNSVSLERGSDSLKLHLSGVGAVTLEEVREICM